MVSVIIPAYKAEGTIKKAVLSALEQASVDEIIVVVDGLFDGTVEKLKQIVDQRLKVIIFEENKGSQIARNAGLKYASSDYIIFLDSDDYFEGPLIAGLVNKLDERSFDLVLAPNCSISPNGQKKLFFLPEGITNFELLIGRILSTLAVGIQCILWKKEFLIQIGGWNENINRNQDGELSIRALIRGGEMALSSEGAGCSVQHAGERVSKRRSLVSFASQFEIYSMVNTHLMVGKLSDNQHMMLKAALNSFCINICIGMAESAYFGKEYNDWKNRIEWSYSHFFLLPPKKSVQALIFFIFGKQSFRVKKVLKRIS